MNKRAGEGKTLDEVTRLITDAGHTVERVINRAADLPRSPEDHIDCVVAAGGDGTVARAGRALAGGPIPLAILPLGTANNIAGSLGIRGGHADIVAAWKDQRRVQIDVGVVRDAEGEHRFLEAVGAGLVANAIDEGRSSIPKNGDPGTSLSHARELYVDMIACLRPRHYTIAMDDETIEGDYLVVEVLNMGSIGPRLRFSAEVNPADGLLSVVVAGETERDALATYMETGRNGTSADVGLKSWRASRVQLKGVDQYHVDDDVREAGRDTIVITVEPGMLSILG